MNMDNENKPVTLHELLASRDARHAMQLRLQAENPGKTLVCLTVVMPGSVKRNRASLVVAHAAVEAMRSVYGKECNCVERDLHTGYEAYILTSMTLTESKRAAMAIEDTHPLGRLFDIDVLDEGAVPVSRERVGGTLRRCLVCQREARYCMRMRWHSQEDIWRCIDNMVNAYLKK